MSEYEDDGRRFPSRRVSDAPEMRDLIREVQELNRRVTVLETRLEIHLKGIGEAIGELKADVAACATKEQLKPAVWLLGIIGSTGVGAFVLTLWNMILKRGGN